MELGTASGKPVLGIVGLRFGAALAVRALSNGCPAQVQVKRLVLWDPVLNGDDFLRVESLFHQLALNDPARYPVLARSTAPARREVLGDELLGYDYPATLRRSISALDVRGLVNGARVEVVDELE